MVGLRVAFTPDGQRMSGVQALCASPDEWSSEHPPEPQEVDLAGTFVERGQRTDAASCAFGQFLVGVGVHVSTADRRGGVVAATPVCRDFHATSE